jgi:tetratricopeptide (TPR) repeat protein
LLALMVMVGFFFWPNDASQPAVPSATWPQNGQPAPTDAPTAPPTTPSTPIAGQNDDKQPDKTLPKNGYDEKQLALAESSFGTPTALADDNVRSPNGQPVADPLKEWKALLRQAKPDYQKAITGLLKAPQNEAAEPLLAYAYFKDKQFDKAAAIYQRLSESGKLTDVQREEAEWHFLMSLLPDRANKQKVDSLISKMMNPDNYHEYQREANELKDKLPND